jgi:hypothetical protein
VGRAIRIDDRQATVIGVMPERMRFPARADLWFPLVQPAEQQKREARHFAGFGRLRAGVSIGEAQADMENLGRRLESECPESNRGMRPVVTPYTQRGAGATPGMLVRQLLTESVVYAAVGGSLGLCLAYWAVRIFDVATAGTGRPYWLPSR